MEEAARAEEAQEAVAASEAEEAEAAAEAVEAPRSDSIKLWITKQNVNSFCNGT